MYDVVVVGAGSAGFAAAAGARETNETSSILLINGEQRLPYDRTALSKRIGDKDADVTTSLHDEEWYRTNRIERIDGSGATEIDRDAATVSVDGHDAIGYRSLVVTTGAEPLFPKLVRPHERGSFYVVRSAQDATELRERAKTAKTVLIAGMGVLAVEIAQQLIRMGKRITLAGATPQLMPRQLSARAGELLEEAMASKKIKLLFQEEIISFERNKKNSWSVEMLKHSNHFDMVVFCIGVEPRTELAETAGIATDSGILVDERLRTDDPAIYAAGDCAQLPDGRISYLWPEAAAQVRVAGINAAGGDERYDGTAFPLHTEVFGLDLYSIGKPKRLWNYRIDEFENGNRYYALYWNEDGRLHGGIVVNDGAYAERVEAAVTAGKTRDTIGDELAFGTG